MGAWDAEPGEYWAFFRDMFEDQVSGTVTYDDMRARMRQSDLEERGTTISRAKDGRYEDPVFQTRYAAGDDDVPFTPTLELNGDTTAPHHDTQEVLNWIESHLPENSTSSVVGESWSASVQQSDPENWFGVGLAESYDTPVVIAKSLTYNGNHPTHVRLQNVGGGRFEFKLEEWDYKDGWHAKERLGYTVLESGTHSLDGAKAEAGRVTTDETFQSLRFEQDFSSTPVVFSQAQTYHGPHAVVTRNRDVTSNGMSVRLQEQDSYGWHTNESVGYLAVEEGHGTLGGSAFEAGRTSDSVTEDWPRLLFDRSYDSPQFVADIQTYHGWDSSEIRYRNLSSSGVEVRIEEERSDDSERDHTTESVGYLVFDGV